TTPGSSGPKRASNDSTPRSERRRADVCVRSIVNPVSEIVKLIASLPAQEDPRTQALTSSSNVQEFDHEHEHEHDVSIRHSFVICHSSFVICHSSFSTSLF